MSSPIRVATVITRMEGGAGVLALRGARALDPDRYRVTLVAGSGGRLLDQAASAGLETVLEPALRPTIEPRRDLQALHRLTGMFTRRGFDVVHTHCAKAGAVGRLAARRARTPRIVHTFHGFPFHAFQSAARRRVYIGIERMLGQDTDVALCVGSGVAAEAVRRGVVLPDRVRTIGGAVDLDAPVCTPQARLRARRALGLDPGGVVVGTVARLTYQKAPEDFVTAMRALARYDVQGVWVGDGELADEVRRLVMRGRPRPRVLLAGERTDVGNLLAAFDVFVLPSRYEGLPLAVLEAMVCGIPVVATAVNAVTDVVVPGETGLLVPPERPELLATAVAHMLDSPAEAARMASAARSRVDERYSEAALAEVLAATYDSGARQAGVVSLRPGG
ncbi:glycosyltransferase involved in cell wall biosynthesis [Halopolyspora algeriensis]|uniref:Glycosyltransferase involved in cell wall biosynthesis n=1 Tax=Halopolyspora algeriensis TaxID=1500506 RepID=A0A368VUS3_9ACTN|nr:glycosyltransferase [Halopolyspora algeriensis]RCW44418.1 glycosyltransferase involved in cell wall biosynthesis [Halopolyspora algeriensis]TQM55779.1 glycosyltransferase involved in cell wall biosynthesis [Halopolyspora algeriensis]